MRSAVRSIAALALAASALPASAFVRETTVRDHPEIGLCLWWRARQVPYAVNATSAVRPPCGNVAAAQSAAAAGLAAWAGATRQGQASACTDLQFVQWAPTTRIALGNDGVNLVVFRSKLCSDPAIRCSGAPGSCAARYNCWEYEPVGTIGLTTTTYDAETGELLDADMELFAWDGVAPPDGFGSYFTCEAPSAPACTGDPRMNPPQSPCTKVDVAAVVTHEAGHMLGLDHVCSSRFPKPYDACNDPASVMVPTVGDVTQRALSSDDVEGVCTIYPAGASTLTCLPGGGVPPPKSQGGGGGGCSSGGGGEIAALLAALGAAVLRRRRR